MFPAYLKFSEEPPVLKAHTSKEFLQNPSYDSIPVSASTLLEQISSSSDSSSDENNETKALEDYKKSETPPKADTFYEDIERKKEYLKLDTLPLRAVPFYRISRHNKHFMRADKRIFRRYFKVKRLKKEGRCTDSKRMLDEKSTKDEEMRIYLIKNTQDVCKWIEYINYKVS